MHSTYITWMDFNDFSEPKRWTKGFALQQFVCTTFVTAAKIIENAVPKSPYPYSFSCTIFEIVWAAFPFQKIQMNHLMESTFSSCVLAVHYNFYATYLPPLTLSCQTFFKINPLLQSKYVSSSSYLIFLNKDPIARLIL